MTKSKNVPKNTKLTFYCPPTIDKQLIIQAEAIGTTKQKLIIKILADKYNITFY